MAEHNDEHCVCGCHDSHGHHHEHQHEHHHDHHHEHGEGHHGHGEEHHAEEHHGHTEPHPELPADGITLTAHEGALIATVRREFADSHEDCSRLITDGMAALAADIRQAGGLVGHIKGTLDSRLASSFSTTGGAVTTKQRTIDHPHAEIVVIVFGLEQEALRELVKKHLGDPGQP